MATLHTGCGREVHHGGCTCREGAEIAALKARNSALVAALERIEDLCCDRTVPVSVIEDAAHEAILSRTDLGRGWASPEVVAQMVGALQMVESDGEFDSLHEVTRKLVVDVLALLNTNTRDKP